MTGSKTPVIFSPFEDLTDPRMIRTKRHQLSDAVAIALFAALRDALAAGDAAAARRAAHSLKSTSASMGALELSGVCRRIEAASAGGELAGLDVVVAEAAAAYAAAAAALRAALDGEAP